MSSRGGDQWANQHAERAALRMRTLCPHGVPMKDECKDCHAPEPAGAWPMAVTLAGHEPGRVR